MQKMQESPSTPATPATPSSPTPRSPAARVGGYVSRLKRSTASASATVRGVLRTLAKLTEADARLAVQAGALEAIINALRMHEHRRVLPASTQPFTHCIDLLCCSIVPKPLPGSGTRRD